MIECIAFDLFGTVFDLSAMPKQEIKDYIAHVRKPEWSPLTLPGTWRDMKPHPASYFSICQQFGPDPPEVLMVTGNQGSPDIEGARAIGMHSVMIRQPGTPQTIIELAKTMGPPRE